MFKLLIILSIKKDAPFHNTTYDLADHLRYVSWDDVFELGVSAAGTEFCGESRLEFMYISLIVDIRSNLIHFHSFQHLVQLP